MNLLKKLTKKDLLLNKKRTVVTIIGIILSVALISAVTTMFTSLYKSLINLEISEFGNFHISLIDVKKEDLKYITENRNIETYHLIEGVGYAHLNESKNEAKPYLYIAGFTEDSLKNLTVNLMEGRLPENDHEIVIPNHLKTNGRVEYKIGQKITIQVGKRVLDGEELNQGHPYEEPFRADAHEEEATEEVSTNDSMEELNSEESQEQIIDTKERTYTIVGIIERPADSIEPYIAPGYTCITKIDDIKNKAIVYLRFTKKGLQSPETSIASLLNVDENIFRKIYHMTYNFEDEEEVAAIENEMNKARFELGDFNAYLMNLEKGILKTDQIKTFGFIVFVVCLIIVITSAFCIKNSFDISLSEKTKQYGMLASIGATKKQIKQKVYYEAFMLGLIGIPLGIILGLIASFILIIICNLLIGDMIYSNMVFSVSIVGELIAVLLGIITLFLSSMRSALRASYISPITAIRSNQDVKINSKKIKSPKIIKKIFGIGGEISYKNLKRSKRKYRTTVISIIVCVAVYIALSSFLKTLYQFVEVEYTAIDYNIKVYVSSDDFNRTDKLMKQIFKRDDIKNYTETESAFPAVKDPKLTPKYGELTKAHPLVGYNEDLPEEYRYGSIEVVSLGDYQYRKYLKELKLDYDEVKDKLILLNQVEIFDSKQDKTVKVYAFDYKKNDRITLGTINYTNEETVEMKTIDFEIAAVTVDRPFGFSEMHNTPLGIVSDESIRKFSTEKKQYAIYLFDAKDPNKFQDDVEKTLKDEEADIDNIYKEQRQMKSIHLLISIFLYGFIAVISLIGLTSVFNTITTNMELRKSDFASLKSIGMTTKEFNRMISLESFFYGTKALLIGIPIGLITSYALINSLNDGQDIVPFKIPYVSILISILIVFIFVSIVMKFSITKINKQNTIETIRNENI